MITWMKRLLLTVSLLALVITNVLTLTNSAFNTLVSGWLGASLGVRTVSSAMQARIASGEKLIRKHQATTLKRQRATRRFGTRLANRTRRVATKSIAAIPAESIPFIGVAVLIADTGYELYAACETVSDLDQLYSELGMPDQTPDDLMHDVCNPQLPQAGDVWNGVLARSEEWLDQARAAM